MAATITRTWLERQIEHPRQLAPHAGGELRRHVDGQSVVAPVGDEACGSMQQCVWVCVRYSPSTMRSDAANPCATSPRLPASGPRTLPVSARAARDGNFHGVQRQRFAGLINHRGIGPARDVHVDDERQRFDIDPDEPHRLVGHRPRGRRDRRDRCAHVAHHGARGSSETARRSPGRRSRRRRRSRAPARAATPSARYGMNIPGSSTSTV